MVKNPPANAGDAGDASLVRGLGRSPGEGNGNPLQYHCLENFMDRGTWRVTLLGGTECRSTCMGPSEGGLRYLHSFTIVSVQFSCSVVSDSLQPHESQHTRPPCPSPTPRVHSDSRPVSDSAILWMRACQVPLTMGFSRQ